MVQVTSADCAGSDRERDEEVCEPNVSEGHVTARKIVCMSDCGRSVFLLGLLFFLFAQSKLSFGTHLHEGRSFGLYHFQTSDVSRDTIPQPL